MRPTRTMSPHSAQNPYAELLDRVAKPARYAGGEVGAVRKDWASVEATVCLAFPDVYDIGASHLGYKILYKILNDEPRTLAERCYCPWVDMEARLRERGLPLVSLESYRPLRDFDVVGFSLQFELTYTNVLTMLDLGGVPLRAEARGQDDPLVVAGGPNATHPEPVAPFFDAIVIGDGEAKLTELALSWTRLRREGVERRERLRALAKLGGVYVPSLYRVEVEPAHGLEVVAAPGDDLPFPIRRATVNIDDYPFPDDSPTGGPEAIFERTSIEITRGCTEGCRFCQAGMIYRPVQERDPRQVIDTVRRAVDKSGNDEVSLTALSTADVSYIHPLIKALGPALAKEGVSLSVASLRAYGLAPELLDELRRVRAGGLTFAPEAGTQRMRDVINKNVTEAQLQETAERVFSRGFDRMKLYFMIGLPTEQLEDVAGIVETGGRTAQIGRRLAGGRAKVTVSVSTHVPKPHTPFQWAAMDSLEQIADKQRLLRDEAKRHKSLTLRTHNVRGSVLEGIMARGDRRLGDVIERAWRHGARFDSWDDRLDLEVWHEALSHHGVDPRAYLGTLPVTARLPWSHLDVGLADGFLAREYRRALKDRLSPPCGKAKGMFVHHDNLSDAEPDQRKLICYDCGVACDLGAMREERLVFLRKLDARERPEPAPAVARTRPKPKVGDPRAGYGYRLQIAKTGAGALLGHLDLVRELPRVLRRIGERMIHTGGYNPKPKLTLSPALSLGVMSFGEYVDLRLERDHQDLDALRGRMNAASPDGLDFVAAARLPDGEPSVSKRIAGAVYLIGFARSALEVDLERRAAELLAAERLMVRRDHKGIGRMRDVRPFLLDARMSSDAPRHLERAGVVGDLCGVELRVTIDNEGSVRVSELAELLNPGAGYRAIRLALECHDGRSPMDRVVNGTRQAS